ncbi:MAG: hypothetical protein HPY67_14020 [Syntrophaceae bacterium]|nr:hypothetical protein [Syntrophaceae bacterium]
MRTAYDYFHNYLSDNIQDTDTLERMRNVIAEFTARAPKLVIMKCIDGRVHGSKSIGYPPTAVRFGRTDGNKVSLDLSNFWYWNRLDRAVEDATFNTPGTPAVFMAYMHRSARGLGCATHQSDDDAARQAIEAQIAGVKKMYRDTELYVMGGCTNTDIMADTLIFPGDIRIDSEEVIRYCNLKRPRDVFHESFLVNPIDDVATSRNVSDKTPDELLAGVRPAFFGDFQTCLNMQNYLLRVITTTIRKDKGDLKRLIRPDIVDYLFVSLDRVALPDTLLGPIVYQIVWNVTYALYNINLIGHLSAEELERRIDHAEEIICYGGGFEAVARNRGIMVKTGRGNDVEALNVAKAVLEKNRRKHKQGHGPLLHINIVLSGELMRWDDFNDNIGSRILTMMRNVDHVFGRDVSILTSYSYRDQMRFYPVKVSRNDPRLTFMADVTSGINNSMQFSNMALKAQEAIYVAKFIESSERLYRDYYHLF